MAIRETSSFVSSTNTASRGADLELCLGAERWHLEVTVESQQVAWKLCEMLSYPWLSRAPVALQWKFFV